MKIFFKSVLLFGLVLFTSSCEKDSLSKKDIMEINYGNSFGECVGYCIRNIEVTRSTVVSIKKTWSNELDPVVCTAIINPDNWSNLLVSFDPDNFWQLPNTIGCPDCADGGAEWVEITMKNGENHKVLFENGDAPASIEQLVSKLRSYLSMCED